MERPKSEQEFERFVKEMGLLMKKRDAEIDKLKQLMGTELKLNAQIKQYKKHLGSDIITYETTDINDLHANFDDKLTDPVVTQYIEKSKYQILVELLSLKYIYGMDLNLSLSLQTCKKDLIIEKAKNMRSPTRLQAKARAFKLNSASTPVYKKKLRSLKHKIMRHVDSEKVAAEKEDVLLREGYRNNFHAQRRTDRDEAFGKGNRSNSKTPWYKHFITRTAHQKALQQAYRKKYKTDQQHADDPEHSLP